MAAGYDIYSKSRNSGERCIEVKASTGNPESFFITRNEIETLKKLRDTAYLYLVQVEDMKAAKGRVVREIQDPVQYLEEHGTLVPEVFSASL